MRLPLLTLTLAACLLAAPQATGDAERKLEAAIHEETVNGNLSGAIEQYLAIVKEYAANRPVAARALVQLGLCQEKLGQRSAAQSTFERALRDYGDQPEVAAKVRPLLSAATAPPAGPRNLSFELGQTGQKPEGWMTPIGQAEIRRQGCRALSACVEVWLPKVTSTPKFGNVMQQFSAVPYRGKTIRVRAWLRLQPATSEDWAAVWFRVDRPNRAMGFFDNMQERAVRGPVWTQVMIVGKIEDDAEILNLGVMSVGQSHAWAEDISFEVVPDGTPVTGLRQVVPPMPGEPRNLTFAQGEVGKVPTGWFSPVGVAALQRQGCHSGAGCVGIWLPQGSKDRFGNLMQTVDAKAFRGKTVRLRASLRIDAVERSDSAQMWFRVDRPNRKMGAFDNMQDRPVYASSWTPAEIVARIDDDAVSLNFGVMSLGKGKAWVDDVAFDVAPDETPVTGVVSRPARPVTNLDFSQGETGRVPTGWAPAVGNSELHRQGCRTSAPCAMVWLPEGTNYKFGNLMQSADAAPYRGKTIRLRAWVRLDAAKPEDKAQVWFRVDRPGWRADTSSRPAAFFDNMDDRPVTSPVWTPIEIVGPIAADAEIINFGLMSIGQGRAWVDGYTLEIVSDSLPATGKYLDRLKP